MPLTRLDNLITSKTGKYLYVSPDDFNASDELNNRGNSPVRPFKSIQRAFLEVARYSYLPGVDNDRFDQFTIMLMPGEHFIDNRPGLVDTSGIDIFGFDDAAMEWTDNSILDLSNPDNIFYKFNNTEGGAIIPRGTSLVGYDLRRTMVKPLYVPDPADSREKRSAIFNVTGGCYFWQFTIKDGETTSLSPLYNPNAAVPSGEVYYSKDDFTKKTAPNYSHHKLTVFEYADKEELELLYRKIAKAFSSFQPQINQPGEFDVRVQENRIVGPLSDSRAIESLQFDDATSDPSIPGSNVRVTVTTKIDHGYFAGQSVAVLNTDIDDKIEGTFNIASIDPTDGRKFTYFVFGEVVSTIGPGSNAGASGIQPGDVLDITSSPALGQNALTLAEVDSVESASPYVFNCSIRSTWGICGIWANGLKATGFKSMVIAQYTGVSLQKDDRAFIRYDEFSNTFNQASLKDAFDSIPYHTKGDSFWKDEWRNFHVRASEDAFIQNVSIFAVGFADHFLMESGGDMSITNSNSNFGNTSLHAIGHKGFAFNSDKGGYIDAIIPPQQIETTDKKINYYPFNIPAMINGVEGIQTASSGTVVYNHTRLYLDSNDDALNPASRPAVSIDGFRLGARQNEKIFTKLESAYEGDDQEYSSSIIPSGFIKYIAKPDILAPAGGVIDNLALDAANLIEANRTFFQEEVFGYVLEKYPYLQNISYVNPGLDPESNRYQDARNLIVSNRDQIIEDAYDSMYTAFGPAGENDAAFLAGNDETKCKRDIGFVVDAIAEDLRDGGNSNIIAVTKEYFNADGTPLANGLVGEERFAIFAFRRARDLCKQAIANLLTVTDPTISIDPANSLGYNFTPSTASYDPATGLFVMDIGAHNYTTDDYVSFTPEGFVFTCEMDDNKTEHALPGLGQPAYTDSLQIVAYDATTITVNVGISGPNQTWTPSAASYDPSNGELVLEIGAHSLSDGEGIVLEDGALTFTCSMDGNDSQKAYPRFEIDPFARRSIPIVSHTLTSITLNVGASGPNKYFQPSAVDYNAATGDMTVTVGQHGLGVGRSVVLADNSFTFTCDQDGNTTQHTYPRPGVDPWAGKSIEITAVGETSHTPTNVTYDAASGIVVFTINGHGFSNGDYIKIQNNSLVFSCVLDGNTAQKAYPRAGYDYPSGRWMEITNVTANQFEINIGDSSYTGAHTFVSAASGAVRRQDGTFTINVGDAGTASGSAHTFVSATAQAIKHEPQSGHTFVSALADGVKHLPQSAHTFVRCVENAIKVYQNTPGEGASAASRNKDARNLIVANKDDIIDAAINAINAYNPGFNYPGGNDTKCRRDLGLIIDAVCQDLWFGGNEYSVAAITEYFNENVLTAGGVDGEVPETIIALNKVQDQMNLAINNQLAATDLTITLDQTGDPAIVSDIHADAFNMITANKKFIAKEAYERMKDVYSNTQYSWNAAGTLGWTPRPGTTEQDCLDDVYDVVDEILYNLKFGGTHKAYDVAEIYVTNTFNGSAITSFLDEERDEAARVFTEAKDIAIDVMRNITVVPTNWTPADDEVQKKDLTVIIDTNNPTCASVEATLDTLFGYVLQGIGTDAGVGNLTGLVRTVPAQPSTYVEGNCSDVMGNIDNLVGLMIDALYAGNLNDLPAVNSGLWDCANVRSTIHTLTDILVDAIDAGSLTTLPPVTAGQFNLNATASKCYRDVGIITDAVINDLRFGGNLNSIQAGEAYFIGNNLEYIDGEKNETLDAWGAIRDLAISSLRNHTTQIDGCQLTNGEAEVYVGSNIGLAIGMRVEQYDPNDFTADAQLDDGASPIYTNIPQDTFIKRKIGTTHVELGKADARLTTGETVPVQGPGGSNITLYFTMEQGQWADTLPTTDPTISTSNAGYPECANVASAVDSLIGNIITIINNGIGSVDLVEATATASDYATRATIFTIDPDGSGSPNPHKFETGTAVRLVPRPRWDAEAGKYVEVDKRVVRLPNGFETNRTYYVIAPGRNTAPYNYGTSTLFNGSDQTKLMLAETRANAAAGIYIYSSESETVDPDVEIDLYKFVLDEKYDLDTYKCQLDVAVAGGSAVTGGIVANVAHVFDVPNANTTPQKVFFRQINDTTPLPLLAANIQGDNALNNSNDSTAGVADANGRLNPEFEFFTRYVVNNDKPNKVFCIYKTHADAINDTNRITFQNLNDNLFIAYANKSQVPFAFDPRGLAYSNSDTGRWYIRVEDTSSDSNPLSVQQESILWRINQDDIRSSPDPKTNDSFYKRQEDNRDADERTYKIRYVIPNYLEGVRDPINGFVLKTRTDSTRRLRPQRILLKPAPGNFKSDAFFQNDRNPGERIGWTSNEIVQNLGTLNNAYDPYRRDTTGAGIDYRKRITTDNNVTMTVQSGRLRDVEGDTYLELNVYDYEPNPEILALNGSSFRTVKITAPQGGLFEVNKSIGSGVPSDPHYITWSGYSSGSAYVHAYTNVGSDHYLIIKGDTIDGNLIYSPYANTRFQQGSIYADLLDDPDMGKSLPLKRLIEKEENDLFYKQNGAPVYTITPGDVIKEDGSENRYVVASVEDAGEIDDTFYIFDIETLQRRIAGQQDGIYYLTAVRGNISPLPLGAGNKLNFRNFKFSQPISYLYPQNYKNDPYWFTHAGTTSSEKAYALGLIDPPATYSAADNYVHGLVRTNDSKSSLTKEMVFDLIDTPAFERNTYTGDNAIAAQEGNASAGAEDRQIPIAGDSEVFVDQKWYVELRRPSIARAGNHTFEYLGFGPGNYSTGLPARQEIVLTATQDYYAQAKRQDGGIVFYTGINSNGELYIGNRKINAITGEEEFLERAALLDSDDDDDDISSLVTTFEVPVTFNQNITVNGGDGELVSNFNSPITINVNNDDLTLNEAPLIILSNVDTTNPDGTPNDPTLGRTSFLPRQSGDIFIGKNEIKAALFHLNAKKNGQSYRFQTHTALELQGPTPSNVTPNQSTLFSAGLGGSALDAKQYVKYGTSTAFQLPQDGDILLKGDSVERSGSLGWIYANYFTVIEDEKIFALEFNGTNKVKIVWNIVNSVQLTNASLGIRETSAIRIDNFYPVGTLNGTFNVFTSQVIGGVQDPFDPNDNYLWITVGESIAGVSYDTDGDGEVNAPTTNPTWANVVSNAGTPINGSTPAPTMQFSTANWKEVGVLGGEALRTKTETIGDYRLGINTVAASAHDAYATAFVDSHTDPKVTLDVVGTAWITGKSIQNYLNEPNGSLISKTETPERNAFWVGGDRDNPDSAATFRVATDLNRVGVNVSSSDTVLDKTFVVDGEVRFTETLTLDNGIIDTANSDFTLAPNSTDINLFPNATELNIANETTATQFINLGNASLSQSLVFGNAATTSVLYIHSNSTNSIIDIGTVGNNNLTFQSQIFMGGAFANPTSQFNIRNRLLKVDGDMQIGTPSTGVTKMYSFTPSLELFSASGGSNDVALCRTASVLTIAADAGTTTINNSLYVKASERVDGNITLFGGLSAGELTATRGIFGTATQQHNLGGVDDLNIDIYKRVEINKTIDTQGVGDWGGTTYIEDAGNNTYYLPIGQIIGNADIAIGDLLLIDREQVDDQVNCEIVRVVTIINAADTTDSEGIRVEVERAQEGTTLKTDHPDNCPITKLTKQENVSYTTSIVPTGNQLDVVQITTAEFGGSINPTDILRISDTELFNVDSVSTDAENVQALRINDGAEPTEFTVFEVLSTTGQTTIEGPTEVRNDILLTGTTSNNDRKLTITDGTNVTFEVDAADGDTKLAGDLQVGSDFDEFVVNGDTGTLTMKGGDIIVKDDAGSTNRLEFINGNGNLTIAGVIETEGTGVNLFAGDVTLNGGDLTVNADTGEKRFRVNNSGSIDLGGIDHYIGPSGARKWLYQQTVSGDAGLLIPNVNYFVKASSDLVLKLPPQADTGDMIRIVDIGGALTYNVRMIFRAPDGIPIAGDSTNTSNAISGVNLAGFDGGELIVTTPNAAFGLIYAGATLTDGQPSGIPSNLQGWWLMEI